jgi:tyrosyl-tRNA synthetase
VLVRGGLAASKKEALRLLAQNGLYLNQQSFDVNRKTLTMDDLASESMMLLRAGKKRFCLVRVEG